MTRPIITLTTDFGEGSHYVAQMKGVILGLNAEATIVDITHSIPAQNIAAGALALREVFEKFPQGTIHLSVVDPGVGTDRKILGLRCGPAAFVAPDNGLLTLVARRTPPAELVQIDNTKYWRQPVSATFHGRDIMAPVAAQLSLGVPLKELGSPVSEYTTLDWPGVQGAAGQLTGTVIAIDAFGNAITNIDRGNLPAETPLDQLAVRCRAHRAERVARTYGDAGNGQLVALFGSNGDLELAVVGGNAAERVGCRPGDEVVVSWEN